MNGSSPTQADVDALNFMDGKFANPLSHPNLFAWQSFVSKFNV
jgi:hypothetical protein